MARGLARIQRDLGERVRERRLARRLTQEEPLAREADISPTYLSQIKTGRRSRMMVAAADFRDGLAA